MPAAEIAAFPLPPMAEDSYLFLWRLSSFVEEAYRVCHAWGFTPKSEWVWRKLTSSGRPWFGMGRYGRGAHETCIIGVRGRPAVLFEKSDHSLRSVFDGIVGEHSQKPEEFYARVERFHPGPYIELFARKRRPGWVCMGNEVEEEPIAQWVAR